MLQLHLLGGLSVRNGRATNAADGQRKSLVLLAAIAAAPRGGITREKLIGYFWPDTNEERGKNALRQRLFALRRDLGEEELFSDATELRLNRERVATDLWDFDAAIAAGDFDRATAVYAGPLLDGVYLRDLPELERWIDEQRTAVAQRAAYALTHVATASGKRGDHERAIATWRRLASFDPASAAPAIGLLEALAASGDAPGALNYFRVYSALLREEYGLDADQHVVAVADAIQRGAYARRDVSPAIAVSTPNAESSSAASVRSKLEPAPTAVAPADANASTSEPPVPLRQRARSRALAAALALPAIIAVTFVAAQFSKDGSGSRGSRPEDRAADSIVNAHRDYRTIVVLVAPGVASDSTLRMDVDHVVESTFSKDTLIKVRGSVFVASQLQDARVPAPYFNDPDTIDANARFMGHAIARVKLARFGRSFALSLSLHGTEGSFAMATFSGDARDSTMLPSVARALTDSAAETLRRVSGKLKIAVNAHLFSPVAVQLFFESNDQNGKGNYFEAVALARASTRADSNYVGAWNFLGRTLWNAGLNRAEALDATARAYRLRGRAPQSGELWFAAFWYASRKLYDSAYAAELARPGGNYANFQGNVRRAQREYALAEQEYRRMIGRFPKSEVDHRNLVLTLLNEGKIAEADSVVHAMETRSELKSWLPRVHGARAEALHDYAFLTNSTVQALADSTMSSFVRLESLERLRNVRAMTGNIRESDSLALLAQQRREALADPGTALRVVAERATLLALVQSDLAGARQVLADGERRYARSRLAFMDRPYAALVIAHLLVGDIGQARHLRDEWERGVLPEYRRVDAMEMADANGEIALAERKPQDALRYFRADRIGGCPACDYLNIARAFDAMKQPDSALFYFVRYIDSPSTGRSSSDRFWLAYAFRRAGEICEQAHVTDCALNRYESFVAMWAKADPALMPTVSEVKRRMDGLRKR